MQNYLLQKLYKIKYYFLFSEHLKDTANVKHNRSIQGRKIRRFWEMDTEENIWTLQAEVKRFRRQLHLEVVHI
jgi:hypothetical protein